LTHSAFEPKNATQGTLVMPNTEANITPETATAPVNPEPTQAKPATRKGTKRKGTKKVAKKTAAARLLDLVTRKAGVTHSEACKALGWKQCRPYLLKVAKQAGIRLRKEREADGQVRFFGRR
jgi:hypothetical protein